jgi:hypothetical protein
LFREKSEVRSQIAEVKSLKCEEVFTSAISLLTSAIAPMPRPLKLRCPICKKPVSSTGPDFPFCSDHCREVDLGKWATGAYVISSPVQDEEDVIRDSNLDDPDET